MAESDEVGIDVLLENTLTEHGLGWIVAYVSQSEVRAEDSGSRARELAAIAASALRTNADLEERGVEILRSRGATSVHLAAPGDEGSPRPEAFSLSSDEATFRREQQRDLAAQLAELARRLENV